MLVGLAGALSDVAVGLSTYTRLAADVLRPRLPLEGAEVDVEQAYASAVDRSAIRLLAPTP
jgi:O-succinylbenzoate synthase